MKRVQVKTLHQIRSLSLSKKSVCDRNGYMVLPAAIVINMSGITILRRIEEGMYVYTRRHAPKWGRCQLYTVRTQTKNEGARP